MEEQGEIGSMAQKIIEARLKEEKSVDPVFNPRKPKPYYKTCWFIFTLIVFIWSFTFTVLFWGTNLWRLSLLKVLTFKENDFIYNYWKHPDCDTIIRIYPFNYTNVDQIGTERPHVQETGPYVFKERIEKVNVVFNPNGTLTYSENRTHEFYALESSGNLDDIIITPNVPFLSAGASGAEMGIISQIGLAALLRGLDTRLFLPVELSGFAMGFEDGFSHIARKIGSLLKGTTVPKFGLLTGRNGLSKERVTIGTGIPDLNSIGVISNYDGESELNYWRTYFCNQIDGSDGSIFPGQVVKNTDRLYIYVKNFCRKIPIQFYGERVITAEGFPAKRYELPPNVFALPSENPENACFCSGDNCSPSGTFNTKVCNFGAPMLISFPHFLHGDPELRINVTGLNPSVEKHRFFLDVHEEFGLPVGSSSRFQLNVELRHCPFLSQLSIVPNRTVLPIAWVDISIGEIKGLLYTLIYHATFTAAYIELVASWTSLLLALISLSRLMCYVVYKR